MKLASVPKLICVSKGYSRSGGTVVAGTMTGTMTSQEAQLLTHQAQHKVLQMVKSLRSSAALAGGCESQPLLQDGFLLSGAGPLWRAGVSCAGTACQGALLYQQVVCHPFVLYWVVRRDQAEGPIPQSNGDIVGRCIPKRHRASLVTYCNAAEDTAPLLLPAVGWTGNIHKARSGTADWQQA